MVGQFSAQTGGDPQPRKKYRTIKSSNYDISNTCNLTCEGCYYFVGGQKTTNKRPTFEEYDRFFAAEVARGVNYPQFSGGEPSLNKIALEAAARNWSSGVIYTNGAKRIPDTVPFRVSISLWGARERNDRLRGPDAYGVALETATGDPRAMILYTINSENIEDIPDVVADCAARGIRISFNDFSMTTEYIRLMTANDTTSNPYVRFSSLENNLALKTQDRTRIADIIDRMIDLHPETVLYTKLINDWTHRSEAIHQIDEATGLATDCAYLKVDWHRGHDFNLKLLKGKRCSAPELDCSDCRINPVAAFALLSKLRDRIRREPQARLDLQDLREHMMDLYFWDWNIPPPPIAAANHDTRVLEAASA